MTSTSTAGSVEPQPAREPVLLHITLEGGPDRRQIESPPIMCLWFFAISTGRQPSVHPMSMRTLWRCLENFPQVLWRPAGSPAHCSNKCRKRHWICVHCGIKTCCCCPASRLPSLQRACEQIPIRVLTLVQVMQHSPDGRRRRPGLPLRSAAASAGPRSRARFSLGRPATRAAHPGTPVPAHWTRTDSRPRT
jgi:hypothetical protein